MNFEVYADIEETVRKNTGNRLQAQMEARTAFERDAVHELGISEHPKAKALMDIAWDLGHSSGYHEVYYYAEQLVPLIR